MSGAWRQHQVWDGTYNLEDLLDWHEMARVRAENDRRRQEWEKAQNP